MTRPLHNHLRRDAEPQRIDHKGAPCAVGGEEFVFRAVFLAAFSALVVDEVDWRVKPYRFPYLLEVFVHLLVAHRRQGAVRPASLGLPELLAAVEDGAREIVQLDAEAVGCLLRHNGDIVLVDIGRAQLGGIGVAQPCEAAEAEHVPAVGETLVTLPEVEAEECHQLIPFEVYDAVGVAVRAFEFRAEVSEIHRAVVAFLRRPPQEPAQGVNVLFDGVVLQVLFDEEAHKELEAVLGEVCELQPRRESPKAVFEGAEFHLRALRPSVLLSHRLDEEVEAVEEGDVGVFPHRRAEIDLQFLPQLRDGGGVLPDVALGEILVYVRGKGGEFLVDGRPRVAAVAVCGADTLPVGIPVVRHHLAPRQHLHAAARPRHADADALPWVCLASARLLFEVVSDGVFHLTTYLTTYWFVF